ncbi:MAG: GNAT family N-acetyltransferase [Eubacterium sp.]|nr:GNAT family N-acetyltransferase [Eubacterium sp.]
MEYIYTKNLQDEYIPGVKKLLFDADHEFVPPLSARQSTTQKNLSGGIAKTTGDETTKGTSKETVEVVAPKATEETGPESYFLGMIQQAFIIAVEDGEICGFMTFIPDHKVAIEGDDVVCDYISTIVVSPEKRKRGITTNMYKTLFRERSGKNFVTRTWSLNKTHISLLNKLGFKLVMKLKNDRGEGIDTVYYGK